MIVNHLALRVIQQSFATLFIIALGLLALYVLSVRVACLYLVNNKSELESALTKQAGVEISVIDVDSSLNGFDPIFTLEGISLGKQKKLNFGKVSVELSFLHSLRQLSPVVKIFTVENSALAVHQSEDGGWKVKGLETLLQSNSQDENDEHNKEEGFVHGELLQTLLSRAHFQLKDLSIDVHNKDGLLSKIYLPSSSLSYSDNKVYWGGAVIDKTTERTLLNFSVEGEGVLSSAPLKSSAYIEARSPEFLGKILGVYHWDNVSIESIDGRARLWLEATGFELTNVQGNLQLKGLNWRSKHDTLPPISNLAADFTYHINDQSKYLSLTSSHFQFGLDECAGTDLSVRAQKDLTAIAASNLDVSCVSSIASATALLSDGLTDRLQVSQPTGELKNLQVSLNGEEGQGFELHGELYEVGLSAYESTPSGAGINGYVYADSRGGYVTFDSQSFQLGFPTLFLEPWSMSQSEGAVSWELSEDDVIVKSNGLRLWFDDDSFVYGDFELLLNDEKEEDYLTLLIGMQNIPFVKATNFVPFYEVGEGLYQWLEGSLKGGVVSSGIYLGLGSVEDNDAQNSFTSSILLNTKDGELKFDPEWPSLTQLNAGIDLQNSQLFIESENVKIGQTNLEKLTANLEEVPQGKALSLNINSHANINPPELAFWLEQSPIKIHTAHISEQLEIKGGLDTTIDLSIPVSEGEGELSYAISSRLQGNQVAHKDSGITFNDIKGVLEVSSEHGVKAEMLDVQAFGQPSTLKIHTEYDDETLEQFVDHSHDGYQDLFRTVFTLNGGTEVREIFRFFGYKSDAFLSGKFNYIAQLFLPNHEQSFPTLQLSSDLVGLQRDWPAPLNKAPQLSESLDLNLHIKPSQLFLGANLKNAESNLGAELLFVNNEFSFGEVSLNEATMSQPSLNGLNIAADLGVLNASDWVSFIQKLSAQDWQKESDAKNSLVNGDGLVASELKEEVEDGIIKRLELTSDRVWFEDHLFEEIQLEAYPTSGRWLLNLMSGDAIGTVLLPDGDEPIELDFERLYALSMEKAGESIASSIKHEAVVTAIRPRDIPVLNFSVKDLKFDNRPYGAVSFSTLHENSKLTFQNIQLNANGSRLEGQLSWEELAPEQYFSIFTAKVKGKNAEKAFKMFGLDSLFSSERFDADIGITWPSSPFEFELAKASGRFDLSATDGFLNTNDKDTGALRLFGVLNAEAITRRLKLDFSDLYKSGVGFDRLGFQSKIDQGLLTLDQPLLIEGPAGNYRINGHIDLAAEALDLDMLVELPFSQNVPLAALVLGAPQIGGLVWVADKLLGEPLSALTTSRYDITGTWDKPVVELKEAVNARKKKRDETVQRQTPVKSKGESKIAPQAEPEEGEEE